MSQVNRELRDLMHSESVFTSADFPWRGYLFKIPQLMRIFPAHEANIRSLLILMNDLPGGTVRKVLSLSGEQFNYVAQVIKCFCLELPPGYWNIYRGAVAIEAQLRKECCEKRIL